MKSSLSLRLLIAAAASTLIALLATALILNYYFRSYFEERIRGELESYLVLLTGNVGFGADGSVRVSELADPRFSEPLSGYYWQVQADGQPAVLSQSLWAAPLSVARPGRRGEIDFGSVEQPDGSRYLTGGWLITRAHGGVDRELFLLVALDLAHLEAPIAAFARNVFVSLGVLGAFLVLASWFQVRVGLKPLDKLQTEVTRVKQEPSNRLSEDYPSELEPLVSEVNALLDHQADTIKAARNRAGTLAHGLKTPLTVMQAIGQDLRQQRKSDIAGEIDAQVDTMQHLVERELARTRDQISARDVWCEVGPVVARTIPAFRRRAGGDGFRWQVDIADGAVCPFDEYALTELLGNLLDNASKWARCEIRVAAQGGKTGGSISVSDDGPGVSEEKLDEILHRGLKLDESIPGQGLGLAIVYDMVTQRGATLSLGKIPKGGFRAEVMWQPQGSDAAPDP